MFGMFRVTPTIAEVLDPGRLAHIVLLHWEGDENDAMDRLMAELPGARLVGSALSIALTAHGFGLHDSTQGFTDGQTLALGRHTLQFLETPHVHHSDSMMSSRSQQEPVPFRPLPAARRPAASYPRERSRITAALACAC